MNLASLRRFVGQRSPFPCVLVTGDLEEIPGVGPANKQKMIDGSFDLPSFLALIESKFLTFTSFLIIAGVENTYQLIGKYLTFKKGTVKEHQDAAFSWLRDIVSLLLSCSNTILFLGSARSFSPLQGVNASRNNIILALAEKCDIFMQGIYDASLYEE